MNFPKINLIQNLIVLVLLILENVVKILQLYQHQTMKKLHLQINIAIIIIEETHQILRLNTKQNYVNFLK